MQDDVQSNSTVSGYVPLYNPVPIYGDNETLPPSTAPVCVSYKTATDKAFRNIVGSGTAFTSSDVDYTLKVSRSRPCMGGFFNADTDVDRSDRAFPVHTILLPIPSLLVQHHQSRGPH